MAVTITKSKAAQKPVAKPVVEVVVEPTELTDEDLADLYGGLQDRADALMADPVFAKLADAKAELTKRLGEYEPTDEITIKGAHWKVEAGACSKSPRSIVDPMAVMNYVGHETFVAIAKVGVGDAEKYLTPDQLATVVNDPGYTKNRKVKTLYLG